MIRYILAEIGRVERDVEVPRRLTGEAKKRFLAAIKEERDAHAKLSAKFGAGTRCLLVIRERHKFATVIHAPTCAYLADFELRYLEEMEPVPGMGPGRWKALAALLDRRRRLLMPNERDKQAEALKEAAELARIRAKSA